MISRAATYIGYLAAYTVASALDLWTTRMALLYAGVSEGNVFATSSGSYVAARAWLITVVGGAIMFACVVFAANHARQVAPTWLEHPVRSFGKMYLSPWSKSVIERMC